MKQPKPQLIVRPAVEVGPNAGDIASTLPIVWQSDDSTRTCFARLDGIVLRAGETAWSIDRCSAAGFVGDEIMAGHEKGLAANKRAVVLWHAGYLSQQFARAVEFPSAAGAEAVREDRFGAVTCVCGAPYTTEDPVTGAARCQPCFDAAAPKPVEAAPVFEWDCGVCEAGGFTLYAGTSSWCVYDKPQGRGGNLVLAGKCVDRRSSEAAAEAAYLAAVKR